MPPRRDHRHWGHRDRPPPAPAGRWRDGRHGRRPRCPARRRCRPRPPRRRGRPGPSAPAAIRSEPARLIASAYGARSPKLSQTPGGAALQRQLEQRRLPVQAPGDEAHAHSGVAGGVELAREPVPLAVPRADEPQAAGVGDRRRERAAADEGHRGEEDRVLDVEQPRQRRRNRHGSRLHRLVERTHARPLGLDQHRHVPGLVLVLPHLHVRARDVGPAEHLAHAGVDLRG